MAAREGGERASGAPADIKWLNDLYLNGKKLCGILTEFAVWRVPSPSKDTRRPRVTQWAR